MENRRRKLIDYFKNNMKKGYTAESLKWALVNQGYTRTEVLAALESVHQELAEKAPILPEKPKISYQVYDENDNPVVIKKPWWKKLLGL